MRYILIIDKPRGECHVAVVADDAIVEYDYEEFATLAEAEQAEREWDAIIEAGPQGPQVPHEQWQGVRQALAYLRSRLA